MARKQPHEVIADEIYSPRLLKGATGFDVGCETSGAYRGAWVLVKLLCKHLVANDDNYALAA